MNHILYSFKIEVTRITFYKIGYDTFSSMPFLKYILVISDDINIKISYRDESASLETVANL